MLQTKLLYLVDKSLFPQVLRRLNDTKNTCIFAIPDENIYHKTREELKMVPLVDDLEKKNSLMLDIKNIFLSIITLIILLFLFLSTLLLKAVR